MTAVLFGTILLTIFYGVPLIVTLVTPARYLGFYLVWIGMAGVLSAVWPRGTDHSSPFS